MIIETAQRGVAPVLPRGTTQTGEKNMFTMQNAVDEQWTKQPKFWEGHEDGLKLPEVQGICTSHWGDDPDIGQTVGLN
jgi:hypothetical protein